MGSLLNVQVLCVLRIAELEECKQIESLKTLLKQRKSENWRAKAGYWGKDQIWATVNKVYIKWGVGVHDNPLMGYSVYPVINRRLSFIVTC